MTSTAQPRALGAFGFAAYMRSGFEAGDEEMIAAKFETLGNRIEALEKAFEQVLVGVNHIATYRSDKWPEVGTDYDTALHILCATPDYDMWCCWNAAMLARQSLTGASTI